MLQVYLDSSGKSHERNGCSYLTLAAITGLDSTWRDFDRRWQRVLDEHEVSYAHMNELVRCKGPFRDWLEDRKVAFAKDLLCCLIQQDRTSLIACIVTIDLQEYRACSTSRETKPPEAVCVDGCMSLVLQHPHFTNGCTEIWFDRNESFIQYLYRTWSWLKSDSSSWASHISDVRPREMKTSVPIQAADLLAWATNRRYTAEADRTSTWRYLLDMIALALPRYHAIYRESELVNHPGFFGWSDGLGV